ncbi:MAG TPA: HDOD domain-containing protein [Gemmatimonadaceae bacterium]|nr:HDOD domain-containing protein [Gemmatimonadaceae bacterium]
MPEVFLARQPIFDLGQRLVGYELLYRPTSTATAAGDGSAADMTHSTLVTALLTIGLDQLTGGARAFINFPRELLLHRAFELLDPHLVTIELLETVTCDDESVEAVHALRARGFDLVLDDFTAGEEYHRLLEAAQIVKIDVLGATRETLEPVVRRLRRYPARLLAERVESAEAYALCQSLGFSLFQGYCFQPPETITGRDFPAESGAIARMMNLVVDPHVTDRDLEAAFRVDPGLSFKLLCIVNSAAVGELEVGSIRHAVRLVGRTTLHRWLSLLLVSMLPARSGIQRELAAEALERGRMCELLAINAGHDHAAAAAFLVGLLSRFDLILDVSMSDVLRHVHVSDDITAALLHGESPLTRYLAITESYAEGDWESAIGLATKLGVLEELPGCYHEARGWVRTVLHTI